MNRQQLRRELEDSLPRFQEAVDLVTTHVRYLLRRRGLMHPDEVNHRVTGRVKSVNSCLGKVSGVEKKIKRRLKSMKDLESQIDDIAGVRIVVPYLDDVSLVYAFIKRHSAFREVGGKFEDHIAKPKWGYRGLHTVVRISTTSGLAKCEIQMRTGLQDAWAVKSHALIYKLKKKDLERLPRALRDLLVGQSDALYTIDKDALNIARLVRSLLGGET
jgi:putative GTP pyrophosphokinase